MTANKRSKNLWSRFARESKRTERRILIRWIRFARRHRQSNWLPVALFAILFMDGFVFVIPSTLLLVGAVTISPKRWLFFAAIFVVAVGLNNTVTYYIGRLIPLDEILYWVHAASIESFWNSAKEAIREYGKYASFVGGLAGLPTQMIMMVIGAADRQGTDELVLKTSMEVALFYGCIGHAIKVLVICGATRYGWVKLERKIGGSAEI